MRCKDFLFQLSDWVSNRLGTDMSARMEEHSQACPLCAEALAEEREMSSLFLSVPAPSRAPDLWYKVSAKLEKPAAAPRLLWRRFYAMGGALAAAAMLCVIVLTNRPTGPTGPELGAGSEDPIAGHSVSQIVYDVQHRPAEEAETAFFENSDYTKRRAVLVGYTPGGE
jgi:hypothetical protein